MGLFNSVISFVLLILIGFLCLAPMLHTIFASFSEPGPLSAHIGFIFRPLGFTLNGYKLVFQNPNIYTGYVNTIIIMRTSMAEISDSLEEAARIDGVGSMTIMTRIVVPLSKATIAVVVLFYAAGQWNAWF